MSVPVQDSLPDLADKPASGSLEPERTEFANSARAGVQQIGYCTGRFAFFVTESNHGVDR